MNVLLSYFTNPLIVFAFLLLLAVVIYALVSTGQFLWEAGHSSKEEIHRVRIRTSKGIGPMTGGLVVGNCIFLLFKSNIEHSMSVGAFWVGFISVNIFFLFILLTNILYLIISKRRLKNIEKAIK